MADLRRPQHNDVDLLLVNARLRDELEPFFDEAITRLNVEAVPTNVENAYLESMLAWERAPVLPISRWFEPELRLPPPQTLDDQGLHDLLWDTIQKLFDKRIVLEFTDHLTDRQLYSLIYRDILPSQEKKIESSDRYLHWDCASLGEDMETWLRYYATEEDRCDWSDEWGAPLPPTEIPPYPRQLPRRPL